jgi:HlyD family secretion protein
VAEIGRRMGRKNVRTDDPTERLDTKILEVVIDLDDTTKLVPGLRLTSYIQAGAGK